MSRDITLRWGVASVHLLALVIGTSAISIRAWALRGSRVEERLRTVFRADSLWGLAAVLWIGTGIWRAFGGLEKGSAYYLGSTAFWVKMSLFGAILALEVWPMTTLIRWRIAGARQTPIDYAPAALMARLSTVQLVLIVLMLAAATAMARGLLS